MERRRLLLVFIVSLALTLLGHDLGAAARQLPARPPGSLLKRFLSRSSNNNRPARPAEIQKAALQVLASLAGGEAWTPARVRSCLAQIRPGSAQSSVEPGPLGAPLQIRHVRRSGRAVRGHCRLTWRDPQTKEQVAMLFGTDYSWVRRKVGGNQVTLMVAHEELRQRSRTIPRDTVLVFVKEALGRAASRSTVLMQAPDQALWQRTTTVRADGRKERYELLNDQQGDVREVRVRRKPDGSWTALTKRLEGKTVQVVTSDSRGARSAGAWNGSGRRSLKAGQALRGSGDGRWTWDDIRGSWGAWGRIRATGSQGKLRRIKSYLVSPLRTPFGLASVEVRGRDRTKKNRRNNIRPTVAASITGPRFPRVPTKLPGGSTSPSLSSSGEGAGLARARQLYAEVSGRTLQVQVRPEATGASHGGGGRVSVSPELYRRVSRSVPALLGLLGHEDSHNVDGERGRTGRTEAVVQNLSRLGPLAPQMALATALLQATDELRVEERRADRRAGLCIGRARVRTGDRSLTVDSYLAQLPAAQTWTPLIDHDTPSCRAQVTRRAYRLGASPAAR